MKVQQQKTLTAAQCRHLTRELGEFEWTWPLRKRFKELGLQFIGDLVQRSAKDFLDPGKIGPKAIKLIEDILAELDGLSLLGRPLTQEEWGMAQEVQVVARPTGPVLLDGLPVDEKMRLELDRPVEFTGLSDETKALLKRAGVKYVGHLVTKTEVELLKIPNLGRKALKEIKELLELLGLVLGMKLENWAPPDDD